MVNAKPKYKEGQRVIIANDIVEMLGVVGTIVEAHESEGTEPVYRINIGHWEVYEDDIAPVDTEEACEAIRERFGDSDAVEGNLEEE